MLDPTGSLSVVKEFIDQAKQCELRAGHMVDNLCWNTATEQRLQAEKLKTQAGVEFLLWVLARMNMPAEPKPWDELQAKLAEEKKDAKPQ